MLAEDDLKVLMSASKKTLYGVLLTKPANLLVEDHQEIMIYVQNFVQAHIADDALVELTNKQIGKVFSPNLQIKFLDCDTQLDADASTSQLLAVVDSTYPAMSTLVH